MWHGRQIRGERQSEISVRVCDPSLRHRHHLVLNASRSDDVGPSFAVDRFPAHPRLFISLLSRRPLTPACLLPVPCALSICSSIVVRSCRSLLGRLSRFILALKLHDGPTRFWPLAPCFASPPSLCALYALLRPLHPSAPGPRAPSTELAACQLAGESAGYPQRYGQRSSPDVSAACGSCIYPNV